MRSPLKEAPERTAGQSLDLRIVDRQFDGVSAFLPALFFFVIAGLEWMKALLNLPPNPIIFTLIALIATGFALVRFRTIRAEIRNYRLGRDGEKIVGQELDKLRNQGAKVHHDIYAEDFNIDHVVVSPKGIFVVETKTWSKPEKGNEKLRYDGQHVIKQGQAIDPNPIEQAQANAQYIRSLLKQSTGREFDIQPILTFPGWFIEKQPSLARFEPWVLNPKVIPSFINNAKPRLSDEDVHLISHRLSLHVNATQSA